MPAKLTANGNDKKILWIKIISGLIFTAVIFAVGAWSITSWYERTLYENKIVDLQKTNTELLAQIKDLESQITKPKTVLQQNVERPVDNEALAYVKRVYEQFGQSYIELDYINWLTGDEAKKAALADGECRVLSACAPNGFYIQNKDSKIETLPLNDNVEILMQTYGHNPDGSYVVNQKINYDEFAKIFAADSDSPLKVSPYHVNILNGEITKITEKYVP